MGNRNYSSIEETLYDKLSVLKDSGVTEEDFMVGLYGLVKQMSDSHTVEVNEMQDKVAKAVEQSTHLQTTSNSLTLENTKLQDTCDKLRAQVAELTGLNTEIERLKQENTKLKDNQSGASIYEVEILMRDIKSVVSELTLGQEKIDTSFNTLKDTVNVTNRNTAESLDKLSKYNRVLNSAVEIVNKASSNVKTLGNAVETKTKETEQKIISIENKVEDVHKEVEANTNALSRIMKGLRNVISGQRDS